MRLAAPLSIDQAQLARRWSCSADLSLRPAILMNGTTLELHPELACGRLKVPPQHRGMRILARLMPAFNGSTALIAPPRLVAAGALVHQLAKLARTVALRLARARATGCRALARALRPIHATPSTRAAIAQRKTNVAGAVIPTLALQAPPLRHQDASLGAGPLLIAPLAD